MDEFESNDISINWKLFYEILFLKQNLMVFNYKNKLKFSQINKNHSKKFDWENLNNSQKKIPVTFN